MRIYWITNHTPTPEQVEDLRRLGFSEIVHADDGTKAAWSSVPPEADEDEVAEMARGIADRIAASADAAVVQGESGATYALVCSLRTRGVDAYHATTRRESVERRREDGSVEKVSVFRHVRFRRYRGEEIECKEA